MRIRPMTPRDVPAALAVYHSVGWGDRSSELEFFLGRRDTALFVAEVGGEVCGCGGATVLGRTGWVHLIAVHPAYRGRGLGQGVSEAAVRWVFDSGAATAMLLASDLGRPVYEPLGFRAQARYAVIRGAPADAAGGAPSGPDSGGERLRIRRATPADFPALLALDRAATGEDRSAILSALSASAWVAERSNPAAGRAEAGRGRVVGFHIPGPWGMGPTVAADAAAGGALLTHLARLTGSGEIALSVPEKNEAALAHLRGRGLEPARYLTRMWLGGPPPRWRPEMIFGVINNGLG